MGTDVVIIGARVRFTEALTLVSAQCASLLREFPYNPIHRMLPGLGLNSISKRPHRGYGKGSAGKVAHIQE